jgi:uncharacterized protein YndB with AHSA1/START domain
MLRAENTVTVDRPISDVFNYLADGENEAQWRNGVLEIKRTSATSGTGATYRQVLAGPLGRRIAGDFKVTAFVPPRQLDFEVIAGPARPKGSFYLTSVGPERTTVRFTLEVEPKGFMKFMSSMINKQVRQEVGQLRKLKTELEERR